MNHNSGRFAVLLILIPFALIARQQVSQSHDVAKQDSNWTQLMRSIDKMHAAMASQKPSGTDDKDFVDLMLPHHQGAVDMAKSELLYGKDPQMRRLAQEIVADQQSEIQLMQLWLKQHESGLRKPN